jgi:glycerol-3-phosphate dehydrogenase
MKEFVFDLAIIGGGINGCGIARDAAGRGLSVFLCEQDDLAYGTSSASTKLIHGGLRYLEYYEFRLVREALREREVLLRAAPHIIRPLRFILPHRKGMRPAWFVRLGLFLYDHLGGRVLLPGTTTLNLATDEAGIPLQKSFVRGFEYSDCRVMDSRLVVLNAIDAAAHGAEINVRTECISAIREGGHWKIRTRDGRAGTERGIYAHVLVNATGPWLETFLSHTTHAATGEHIRMVKGSHIIVKKLFDHERAYLFQNPDGRIIFAIPYEQEFTLIGTTDVDFHGTPGKMAISPEEIDYLCHAANEYFVRQIQPIDVVHSFSGIRPLFDDGKNEAKAATRDYILKVDTEHDVLPLLSVYGGKLTTYRKLAEAVLKRLAPYLPPMQRCWTETTPLPGGDFHPDEFEVIVGKFLHAYPMIDKRHVVHLIRTFGTKAFHLLVNTRGKEDLGEYFGDCLYEKEVCYLMDREWARTAEDVLWRRTNLGLFLDPDQTRRLETWMRRRTSELQHVFVAESACFVENG